MFIVKCGDTYFGPFLEHEAIHFRSEQASPSEILPLHLPNATNAEDPPMTVALLSDTDYRARSDSSKIDTLHAFAFISWECHFAKRDRRVFTATEISQLWETIVQTSRAVESLMYYAEKAIENPSQEAMVALRKAVWRNRDSDDIDPHYRDRFW